MNQHYNNNKKDVEESYVKGEGMVKGKELFKTAAKKSGNIYFTLSEVCKSECSHAEMTQHGVKVVEVSW